MVVSLSSPKEWMPSTPLPLKLNCLLTTTLNSYVREVMLSLTSRWIASRTILQMTLR